MVVQNIERPGWFDCVTIEVSEHLLAPLEPRIGVDDDRDVLVAQFRMFRKSTLKRFKAMLSVVDQ
jgi:hypothetical protein